MNRYRSTLHFVTFTIALCAAVNAFAQTKLSHEEIIYGHKEGTALVMEKVNPTKPNGKSIIMLMSGGYHSDYSWLPDGLKDAEVFLNHGYTVFLVFHGSQPRFNMIDITNDVARSIRFIRFHAKKFSIDPNHIGIFGASSGGHLSLYAATSDGAGDPKSKDPIDQVSAKIQAACVFYPPTDFLNFGKTGADIEADKSLMQERAVSAAFDFRVWNDSTQTYDVPSNKEQTEIIKNFSPVYAVTSDDAPALLVHGTNDWVVPIQQSELIMARYKAAGVPCELVIKQDAEHGWKTESVERETMAKWFDKYLK